MGQSPRVASDRADIAHCRRTSAMTIQDDDRAETPHLDRFCATVAAARALWRGVAKRMLLPPCRPTPLRRARALASRKERFIASKAKTPPPAPGFPAARHTCSRGGHRAVHCSARATFPLLMDDRLAFEKSGNPWAARILTPARRPNHLRPRRIDSRSRGRHPGRGRRRLDDGWARRHPQRERRGHGRVAHSPGYGSRCRNRVGSSNLSCRSFRAIRSPFAAKQAPSPDLQRPIGRSRVAHEEPIFRSPWSTSPSSLGRRFNKNSS